MYKLKQIPEDFVVEEISNVKIKDSGRYADFKLKKINRNTLDVVKELAKQLRIKEKNIGFAGSKDKHAVTEQIISIPINKEKVVNTKIDNVKLEFLGYGKEPITLGSLAGNKFIITVRNLDNIEIKKIKFVENYFDEQRFSKHNKEIGKHIIKKEFKESLRLIDNERSNTFLKEHPNDYIGALKKIPLRLLKMYVHAYQSYLWNETLALHLSKKEIVKEVKYSLGKFVFTKNKENLKIPLLGFATENQPILEKESITTKDFIIKQIPELSLEGDSREAFVEIKDLEISKLEPDELNKGKYKIKLSFSLPKGSYATMVVKRLFS